MLTKEQSQAYESLPTEVKSVILALSVLIDRIGSLPKVDRDELFELLQEWRKASDPEEQASIHRAMEEILAQIPVNAKAFVLAERKSLSEDRKAWAEHVGRRIKEFRKQAGLSQEDLAARANLPQSHISRLENAEYTATNRTIEKIAKALGIAPGSIDPCLD